MVDTAIRKYDRFGIYSGGEVTKFGQNEIRISPYALRLSDTKLRGSGSRTNTFSKHITIGFSNSSPTSSGYSRENLQDPKFLLTINTIAPGQAWIYYDQGAEDIQVKTSVSGPTINTVIFAKITWGGGTDNINELVIDYTERTESLMISTTSPEDPVYFYQDGQTFTSSSINEQYANIAVLTEVMQSESLLNFGDNYFVTMAREASGSFNGDIYGSNLNVYVKDIRHFSRVGSQYNLYHNKADSGFTDSGISFKKAFSQASDFQNKTIYVGIEKNTGKLRIETTWDSTTEENYYMIAYAQTGSETTLDNVHFYIVNNLGGQALFLETFAKYLRSRETTSFLSKVNINEIDQDNKLRLDPCILNLDGYLLFIPGNDIVLSAPPSTGKRYDFVYLEIEKKSVPWIQLSFKIKVVSGVDFFNKRDPFLDTVNVKNSQENTYTYNKSGSYTADLSSNGVDGKTHAIPLCVINRLNTGAFSGTNKNGGTGRPDGRSALRVNLSEVENRAPIKFNVNPTLALNSALFKILSGKLNNKLQPALSDPEIFSRSPLQIDRLGVNSSLSDSSFIGLTDGMRTIWSRNQSKISKISAFIKEDVDSGISPYNFPTVDYDSDTKTIIVKVPDNTTAEIVKDQQSGRPLDILIRWVKTGRKVKLSSQWSIGQLRNSTAVIDTSDADYIINGEIAITFSIKYTDITESGLKRIPEKVISAANNNDYNILANSYAVAVDEFNNPTYVRDTGRISNINSVNYKDYLSLVKMGSDKKFYSYEMHYFLHGNNSNTNEYEVNDTIASISGPSGNYSLVGLIDVKNALTGESIPVTKVKWKYNSTSTFQIRLSLAIAVNAPIEFIFAVGGDAGKQIDLNKGSLEISNITETKNLAVNGSIITNLDGVYYLSNGNIIYGASAFREEFKVYVGEDLVPAKITGIGDNLLKVIIQVSDISSYTTANWYLNNTLNKYVPNNGVTIRIPVLQSYRTDNSQIYIQYIYNSLPFMPFKPDSSNPEFHNLLSDVRLNYGNDSEKPKVIERGFLIMSTDGSANDSASMYAPVDQKFPVVQNIPVVGINTPASNLGMSDIFIFQQQLKPFIEGTQLTLDNQLILSGIVQAGTGIAVWACLIKMMNCIRLFIFEVRDGTFVLGNKDQAFICELEENYRELI